MALVGEAVGLKEEVVTALVGLAMRRWRAWLGARRR